MRWIILVLLMALCILTLICYALCVMAHEADERAERMYRKWKESNSEKPNNSTCSKMEQVEDEPQTERSE